jgi:O-antigen/teichoic acid export membrane protein
MGKLMNVGIAFFALQLVYIFILLTDKMIITQLLGPSEVTSYDIVYRIMSVVLVLHGVVNAPMWSAYTEAYSKNDILWIKNNLKKMNYFIIVLILIVSILSIFYKEIVSLWIGRELNIKPSLVVAMAVYVIVVSWNNNFAFFVNAINQIKWQLYAYTVGAILNIPLSIYFVKVAHLGSMGVVLATIISLFIFSVVGVVQTLKILSDDYRSKG